VKLKLNKMAHNPFENQHFAYFRAIEEIKQNESKALKNKSGLVEKAKEVNKAIELLKEHRYTIIDHQNNWIKKEN
tara:strand:+ start:1102 stop:1326 length:225 start_codon:yes stop_codon:yes gene_type:complete